MQTCILIMGILLTSQVTDSGGRYTPVTPPAGLGTAPGNSNLGAPPASFLGAPPASLQQPATGSASRGTAVETNPLRSSIQQNDVPPTNSAGSTTRPGSSAGNPLGSTARPEGLTKVIKPVDLLSSLVHASTSQALAGQPLSLSDAVETASSRIEQSQRVALYWQLSRAVSDYRLAQLEETQVRAQQGGLLQASAGWALALQSAKSRKQVAFSAFRVAQIRMQKAIGLYDTAQLPVPTDLPHCGKYRTEYDKIFQSRTSHEALQLAELLPLRHKQLNTASAEITAAGQWHRLVSQQRGAQSDDRLLLKAYEQLALQRREFVAWVYQYNENITRYTELAVPQNVGAGRLVAMLIQTPGSAVDYESGSIRRASAEESSAAATAVDRYKPKTFAAEAESNEAVKTSVPDGDERSILVKPGQVLR